MPKSILGVIGGSGIYDLPGLENVREETIASPWGADVIVNMSVWRDAESLHAYAFQSGHVEVMKRRREWFQRMVEAYLVLWWIPAGHRPDVAEAARRLDHLRRNGPTPEAFTFREALAVARAD